MLPSSKCPSRFHRGKNHIAALGKATWWRGGRRRRCSAGDHFLGFPSSDSDLLTVSQLASCPRRRNQHDDHSHVKHETGDCMNGHNNLARIVLASSPVRLSGSTLNLAPSISPTPSSLLVINSGGAAASPADGILLVIVEVVLGK